MKTTILVLLAFAVSIISCKNLTEELLLTVDETPITATAEGGEFFIAVKSNQRWTAIIEDAEENIDWCALSNNSGTGDGAITLNITPNTTSLLRNADVKIISGELTKSVAVNQAAQEIVEEECLWDYPVKQGTPEWAEFNNNAEKVAACQIPEDVLNGLSTACLTTACLQYPLFHDIYASNFMSMGFNKFFENFNGVRELYNREKASNELLKQYQDLINDMSILDGAYIFSVSDVELLLYGYSQKVEVPAENYREILRRLTAGYEKKIEYADYFQGLGFNTNLFTRANIIVKISPESLSLLQAALSGGTGIARYENTINELSYQLIRIEP